MCSKFYDIKTLPFWVVIQSLHYSRHYDLRRKEENNTSSNNYDVLLSQGHHMMSEETREKYTAW